MYLHGYYGSNFTCLFPIISDSEYEPNDYYQMMGYTGRIANFNGVRHCKASSKVYRFSSEETTRINQLAPTQPVYFVTRQQQITENYGPSGRYVRYITFEVQAGNPPEPLKDVLYPKIGNSRCTLIHQTSQSKGSSTINHSLTAYFLGNFDSESYETLYWYSYNYAKGTWKYVSSRRSTDSVAKKYFDFHPTQVNMAMGQCLVHWNGLKPQVDSAQIFGDLCVTALKGLHATEVSMLEYLQGLNIAADGLALLNSIRSLNFGSTLKEISDVYLSYSFGAPGAIKDTQNLVNDISKALTEVKRLSAYSKYKGQARTSVMDIPWLGKRATGEFSLTAYLNNYDDGIMKLMTDLNSWNLYPSASNLWNLVPLSFVIDWFVNVQENLERFDYTYWREYYSVHACILSSKFKTTTSWDPTTTPGLGGQVDISLYTRSVQRELPVPMVDLDLSLPTSVHQFITGAALVVQRKG